MPRTPISAAHAPRAYPLLWGGTASANLADGIMLAIGPLLAAAITRDPALVAGIVVAQRTPWLLFVLFAGVIVDRVDRRWLLIAGNLLRFAARAMCDFGSESSSRGVDPSSQLGELPLGGEQLQIVDMPDGWRSECHRRVGQRCEPAFGEHDPIVSRFERMFGRVSNRRWTSRRASACGGGSVVLP